MGTLLIGAIVLALGAEPSAAGDGAPAAAADAAPMSDRQAAEAGDAAAQRRLGRMYEQGMGAPPDLAEALRWYRRAADQGDVDAQDDLGRLYSSGLGGPEHAHDAALWELKAAAAGDRLAAVMLGERYFTGNGLPRDLQQARAWYRRAGETVALCYTYRRDWLTAAATRRAGAMDSVLAAMDPECTEMIARGRTWSARLRAGRAPRFTAEAWMDAQGPALQCGPAAAPARPAVAGGRAARTAFAAWEQAHWPAADRRKYPRVLVFDDGERWIVFRTDAPPPPSGVVIWPDVVPAAGQLELYVDKCRGAVTPAPPRPPPAAEDRDYE